MNVQFLKKMASFSMKENVISENARFTDKFLVLSFDVVFLKMESLKLFYSHKLLSEMKQMTL